MQVRASTLCRPGPRQERAGRGRAAAGRREVRRECRTLRYDTWQLLTLASWLLTRRSPTWRMEARELLEVRLARARGPVRAGAGQSGSHPQPAWTQERRERRDLDGRPACPRPDPSSFVRRLRSWRLRELTRTAQALGRRSPATRSAPAHPGCGRPEDHRTCQRPARHEPARHPRGSDRGETDPESWPTWMHPRHARQARHARRGLARQADPHQRGLLRIHLPPDRDHRASIAELDLEIDKAVRALSELVERLKLPGAGGHAALRGAGRLGPTAWTGATRPSSCAAGAFHGEPRAPSGAGTGARDRRARSGSGRERDSPRVRFESARSGAPPRRPLHPPLAASGPLLRTESRDWGRRLARPQGLRD